jgi:hypothetical protein
MCVTRLTSTGGVQIVERRIGRPVQLKAYDWYRVLREAQSRGCPRSVDRDCAGRNAEVGVKGLSSEKPLFPWWPSRYDRGQNKGRAKAASVCRKQTGTTGVRGHGMYRRPMSKRERSAESRAEAQSPWLRVVRQGVNAESATILTAEVRCLHSSDEVVEIRWSEGRHGE